jgi:hypothetical protein
MTEQQLQLELFPEAALLADHRRINETGGAGRLLAVLVRQGLDERALVAAAAMVVLLDTPTTRVVHLRREPYDIYIGREMPRYGLKRSKWFNPYKIGKDGTRERVLVKYEQWVRSHPDLMTHLPELRGKVLGCWCSPKPCHGDVLARLANGGDAA